MSHVLYSLAGSLLHEGMQNELVSRNIGGASIPGYKREYVFTQAFQEAVDAVNERPHHLRGARAHEVLIDFSQGELRETHRALDFAIMGENAFFEVKTPDGKTLYTRNGGFFADNNGNLVTAEGYKVSTTSGTVKFNREDNLNRVEVCQDGSVRIRDEQNKEYAQELGQLRVVRFDDPQKLRKVSGKYFIPNPDDPASPAAADPKDYQVVNRYVESSNASPVLEMVNMVASYRRYEIASKLMRMRSDSFSSETRTYGG